MVFDEAYLLAERLLQTNKHINDVLWRSASDVFEFYSHNFLSSLRYGQAS